MRLSQYFLPLLKEKPAEAEVPSHTLMLRSGMIRRHASGIYNWLPLGLKVLKNIANIIRHNMDKAGCIEILTPCIQDANLWHESKRYDSYGKETLRFKDRHNHELLFGPTGEEVITDIVRNGVQTYRDLPKIFYQLQWKFRDEIRPRFGVMRGREFLMKDAYSFDIDEEGAMRSYDLMFVTYMRIFHDLGLRVIPLVADPGVIGGKINHEFNVIASTGESEIYYDKKFTSLSAEELINDPKLVRSLYAATAERHPIEGKISGDIIAGRGIEVGHIFNFADKYSIPMRALVATNKGENVPMQMGSYGIGVSRLVAAIIEAGHDDEGIIWPYQVAPFYVSLINLKVDNENCCKVSEYIYHELQKRAIEVLYDDQDNRPGVKFATHNLIGSPWQIIVSLRGVSDDGTGRKGVNNITDNTVVPNINIVNLSTVSLKNRKTGLEIQMPVMAAIEKISSNNILT